MRPDYYEAKHKHRPFTYCSPPPPEIACKRVQGVPTYDVSTRKAHGRVAGGALFPYESSNKVILRFDFDLITACIGIYVYVYSNVSVCEKERQGFTT